MNIILKSVTQPKSLGWQVGDPGFEPLWGANISFR